MVYPTSLTGGIQRAFNKSNREFEVWCKNQPSSETGMKIIELPSKGIEGISSYVAVRNPKDPFQLIPGAGLFGGSLKYLKTFASRLDGNLILFENIYDYASSRVPFGVEEIDRPEQADRRLYERAKSIFKRNEEFEDHTKWSSE